MKFRIAAMAYIFFELLDGEHIKGFKVLSYVYAQRAKISILKMLE